MLLISQHRLRSKRTKPEKYSFRVGFTNFSCFSRSWTHVLCRALIIHKTWMRQKTWIFDCRKPEIGTEGKEGFAPAPIPSERDFCGFDWQPLEAACTDFASGASRPSPIHTSSKPPIQSCKVHFGAHLNLNKSFYWAELDMRYLRAQTPLAPVQYSSNARAQHSKITYVYAIQTSI